jgi:hypothetical protein
VPECLRLIAILLSDNFHQDGSRRRSVDLDELTHTEHGNFPIRTHG